MQRVVTTFFANKDNRVATVLVIGLWLFIAVDRRIVYSYPGFMTISTVGEFILLIACFYLVMTDIDGFRKIGLGPKCIWIPLAVIAGSAIIRALISPDVVSTGMPIAGAYLMVGMFGLYLVCRKYGEQSLRLFMPATIIGAISIIIQAIIYNHSGNSGLLPNYATASEFLIFGWLVSPQNQQWWLSGIVMTGLFFTGAPEAIFYATVIGIVLLIRRDWSRKILLPLGALSLCLLTCTPIGTTWNLWGRSYLMANDAYIALTDGDLTQIQKDDLMNRALDERWKDTWVLHRPIQPLGYGVRTNSHNLYTPHNIVLLMTDELGPVASAAWLAMIAGGIWKTKWRYGYLSLLLFGVFQPFIGTEMIPYVWALNGAATSSSTKTSYIFKDIDYATN
jgi:hypothetical protein